METGKKIRKIKTGRRKSKRESNSHYNLDKTPKKVFQTKEEAEEFLVNTNQNMSIYGCRTCQRIHIG